MIVMDQDEAVRFLKGWGITTEEWIVRRLVMDLPDIIAKKPGHSLRSFYRNAQYSEHISKATAQKIKRLFEAGSLDPCLYYLELNKDWHPLVGEKQFGGRVSGVLTQWLAGLGEDSLREVLRSLHFMGLLPEDLIASAKELILPGEIKILAGRGSGKSTTLTSILNDMAPGEVYLRAVL